MTPTKNESLPELLPCPFCGNAPVMYDATDCSDGFVHGTTVACQECGISIADEYRAEAIEGWNRRHFPGQQTETALTREAPPEAVGGGADFENLCIAVQICRDLSWNAVTSEKPGSLTDKIARLVAYVERRKS